MHKQTTNTTSKYIDIREERGRSEGRTEGRKKERKEMRAEGMGTEKGLPIFWPSLGQ